MAYIFDDRESANRHATQYEGIVIPYTRKASKWEFGSGGKFNTDKLKQGFANLKKGVGDVYDSASDAFKRGMSNTEKQVGSNILSKLMRKPGLTSGQKLKIKATQELLRAKFAEGGNLEDYSDVVVDVRYRDASGYKKYVENIVVPKSCLEEYPNLAVGDELNMADLNFTDEEFYALAGVEFDEEYDHDIVEIVEMRNIADIKEEDRALLNYGPSNNGIYQAGGELDATYFTASIYFKDKPEEILDGYVFKEGDSNQDGIGYDDEDIFYYVEDEAEMQRLADYENGQDFVVISFTKSPTYAKGGKMSAAKHKRKRRVAVMGVKKATGGSTDESFDLSSEELQLIEDGEQVEYGGHWVLSKINNQYEATRDGLYMYVWNTLEGMLSGKNEDEYYEYDADKSEKKGEETFVNAKGKVRKYAKGGILADLMAIFRRKSKASGRNLSRDRMFVSQQEHEKNYKRKKAGKRYQRATGGEAGEPNAWEFVSKYYPDYYSSSEIAENDDLHVIYDNEEEEGSDAYDTLQDTYDGDRELAKAAMHESDVAIYEKAIENYIETKKPEYENVQKVVEKFSSISPKVYNKAGDEQKSHWLIDSIERLQVENNEFATGGPAGSEHKYEQIIIGFGQTINEEVYQLYMSYKGDKAKLRPLINAVKKAIADDVEDIEASPEYIALCNAMKNDDAKVFTVTVRFSRDGEYENTEVFYGVEILASEEDEATAILEAIRPEIEDMFVADDDFEDGKISWEIDFTPEEPYDKNRLFNFMKDDLAKLEKAINESDKEEVERFFSYWGIHLGKLKTPNNDRMFPFLKEDLAKLKKAFDAGDKQEIERFFSYWGQHLDALKMAKGGSAGSERWAFDLYGNIEGPFNSMEETKDAAKVYVRNGIPVKEIGEPYLLDANKKAFSKMAPKEEEEYTEMILEYLSKNYPDYTDDKLADADEEEYNDSFFEMVDDIRLRFLLEDEEDIANGIVENYMSKEVKARGGNLRQKPSKRTGYATGGSLKRSMNSPLIKYANFDRAVVNLVGELIPSIGNLFYKNSYKYAVQISNLSEKTINVFEFKTIEEAERTFDEHVNKFKKTMRLENQGVVERTTTSFTEGDMVMISDKKDPCFGCHGEVVGFFKRNTPDAHALVKLTKITPELLAKGIFKVGDQELYRFKYLTHLAAPKWEDFIAGENDKTLIANGIDIAGLTAEQKEEILMPINGPENYYQDGQLSEPQAKLNWISNMQKLNIPPAIIRKASKQFEQGGEFAKGGRLIASYKEAVSEFNKELLTHPMVEKMAKHYGKTPAEVVKALQVRLSTKANKEGKTIRVYIDFTDTDSGIAVKHKKEFV
jgi:hypothetical protein